MSKELTAERLRELLDFDQNTGLFTWKASRGSNAKAGTIAGFVSQSGYTRIQVDGMRYYTRALAHLYVYGEWPKPANKEKVVAYKGQPPSAPGWKLKGFIHDGGIKWMVYAQEQKHFSNWVNLKICAEGRVERKANYWFAVEKTTGRAAKSKDRMLLVQNRPSLAKAIDLAVASAAI